jgi:glycerol kinase
VSILAIDQGTSATKAVVWSEQGIAAEIDVPMLGLTHSGDAVEQDPEALWDSIVTAGRQALESCGTSVRAVAIGNQGETVLAWDRSTGQAIGPALSWQDRRSASVTAGISPADADALLRTTGLPVDPYFAAPKISWLRRRLDLPAGGDAVVTTIDAWVNYRLAGAYATDLSTASRTQLLDGESLQWSSRAAEVYGLPDATFPDLVPCDATLGTTTAFGPPLPVAGLMVDQQAALLAEGCTEPGSAKCTYGTGIFLLANIGRAHVPSTAGLATSLAWAMRDGTRASCVDGQVYSAGAAVAWLQRAGLITGPEDLDALAGAVHDTDGVRFDPSFSGRGAPHWDPSATASITGLGLSTRREHLVRAFLEGLAAEVTSLARAVESDVGGRLTALRVDGGLTQSAVLMQLQADSLGVPVEVYPHSCATALGLVAAALRALDGAGAEEAVIHGWQPRRVFEPAS